MSTIFYGVCGEGRGHAARVRTMVEELREHHRIHIFAPAMAYDMLAPIYQDSDVRVHHIPGLCFEYNEHHQVNYLRTGWRTLRYLSEFNEQINNVVDKIEHWAPELVITDFEPIVSRAAERTGVPYVSLDHQQFMLTFDLSSLPRHLQRHAVYMSRLIKAYYTNQAESIVSSFYFPPLRPEVSNVTQIGVLLRSEIVNSPRERGRHVVAYLRRQTMPSVFTALAGCGSEVKIYGVGKQPRRGNLTFCEIDMKRFVDDLASSRALISTAGNQLVGEALFLDKPVLAMPEPNNYEQYINGHFLAQTGAGISVEMEQLTVKTVTDFLERFTDEWPMINRVRLHGNPTAVRLINRYLTPEQPAPAWWAEKRLELVK